MTIARATLCLLLLPIAALNSCQCDPPLPTKPVACVVDVDCLPDEVCTESQCVRRPACENDDSCPSAAWQCVRPAQFCALRPGFGEECSPAAPCEQGKICQLGVCVAEIDQRPCSRASDCPQGQRCSQTTFTCIQDVPCTLAEGFPEAACDFDERCDAFAGSCRLPCQNECEPASDECGSGLQCDGSCRCVQCLLDTDCGPGLLCNQRSGRCQPENLCFDDSDCALPLICDATTALCQSPPPPCESDFDCAIAEICNLDNGRCQSPQGPCDDDYLEDSDTPASAEERNLVVGDVEVLDDLRLCPDDDDILAIAMLSGETLIAEATNTEPAARAAMWVLDPSASTSLAFAEAPPRGNGRAVYTASSDEVVYLRINALLAQTRYDLRLEKIGGAACVEDLFEGATSNDRADVATPESLLQFGSEMAASICPRDVDHYRVEVPAGEGLTATLSFDPARGDLDIEFVDAISGEVLANGTGQSQPTILAQRFGQARSVLVRVKGFVNAVGSYTLRLERGAAFVCADALEPDVPAPTLVLSNGAAATEQQRALCTDDADAWVVELEDFERLEVTTQTSDPDLRVELEARVGGVVVATGVTSPFASTLVVDASVPIGERQTVVVRARGRNGSVGNYTVRLRKINQGGCVVDGSEPNNRTEEASPLPPAGAELTICESDNDFYLIEAGADRRITIDARFQHALGDIDITLLGLDGFQALAVSDGVTDLEHIEFVAPLEGSYRLRVFSLTNNASNRYTLEVVVQP